MKKILCADDDPTIRRIISESLQRFGYEVILAADGAEALARLKQDKPDLLLLDVMMPELNGYDVCFKMKFDPDLKPIPVILLTCRDQELDSRLGVLMGIEYLHKSCSSAELVAKVQQVLGAGNAS